jgi:hypothetical protein
MNKTALRVKLETSPEQAARLRALQAAFAQVCNALAPLVQQTRTWNRVALHHLAYKALRERFPAMGSQMICNAIYSVSRTGRMVFQHPASPFLHTKLAGKPLPLLRFSEDSPVYFDRHTLSMRGDQLSLYTLDGRVLFRVDPEALERAGFRERKLREVVMIRRPDGRFELTFRFAEQEGEAAAAAAAAAARTKGGIPEYVQVQETP